MRYDSDPYIVKKILMEADVLQASLSNPRLGETLSPYLFTDLEPLVSTFLSTLDHLAQLHSLNPQLSLSRFSANAIEQRLLALQASILHVFSLKEFPAPVEQARWNKERFLIQTTIHDDEQLFIALYKKLAQIIETYYVHKVRETHFAALLNQVVGWSEHIETHGHHDIHAVILFAEKIARDKAVIENRVEVVREICAVLLERSFLRHIQDGSLKEGREAASELSRIYSPYLLELYEALLEDMEIIAISEQDYHAFEKYCQENQIEVYEEYHNALKKQLRKYVEGIAIYIPSAFRIVSTANIIMNAELTCERYKDVDTTIDVLGVNLAKDIRILQRAVRRLKEKYPQLSQRYTATLHKVKRLKGEIVKPAIQVYSQYINEPTGFFERLPQNQAEWIPIIESALACLEPNDDLYRECYELKTRIDQFLQNHSENTPETENYPEE